MPRAKVITEDRLHTQDCHDYASRTSGSVFCTAKCDAAFRKRLRRNLQDENFRRLKVFLKNIKQFPTEENQIGFIPNLRYEARELAAVASKILRDAEECCSEHGARDGHCPFGVPYCKTHPERQDKLGILYTPFE